MPGLKYMYFKIQITLSFYFIFIYFLQLKKSFNLGGCREASAWSTTTVLLRLFGTPPGTDLTGASREKMILCASCTQIGMSAPSLCISQTRDPSRPAPQSWKPPSHPWKGGCPSGDFLVALTTRDKAGWPFLSVCPTLRSLWVTFSS